MDIPVGNILEGEFSAACSEIALLVPITLKIAANGAHHGKASNIKLTILVQQGSLDILLDYVTSFETIHIGVADEAFNLIEIFRYLDSATSIGVLTWLDDPQLLTKGRNLIQNSLLRGVLGFMVKLFKFMKLWIIQTFLDMELQRQNFVVFSGQSLIVYFHVVVDSLLVRKMIVVLHLRVVKYAMTCVVLLFFFLFVIFLVATNPLLGSFDR